MSVNSHLIWLPSHTEIGGNEMADVAAKKRIFATVINIPIQSYVKIDQRTLQWNIVTYDNQ